MGVDLPAPCDLLQQAIQVDRLVDTAVSLIEVPSPTRDAAAVADRLAVLLSDEGFELERPAANWPQAPAVVARFQAEKPGPTLQFHGHLDTVHLPFVAPRVSDGILYGSGASDMKGGIAAMVEALRAVRDTNLLASGEIMITAVDLHEAPWGDGSQVRALIEEGFVGDAVLIPEYLADRLPLMGRGMALFEVTVQRDGEPVHEVFGGLEQPRVIAAGAELVSRFEKLDHQLANNRHPYGDRDSIFIGQVGSGEIYNQSPTHFKLCGTRRWLPGADIAAVEREYRDILATVASPEIQVEGSFHVLSEGFELVIDHPVISAFQAAYQAAVGQPLPPGSKPFLDDGNHFAHSGITAITHGPAATGAHTVGEEVLVAELERMALVYALTACCFCNKQDVFRL